MEAGPLGRAVAIRAENTQAERVIFHTDRGSTGGFQGSSLSSAVEDWTVTALEK